MQEAREAVIKPGAIPRRREYIQMDRTLQHIVRTAPLNTDQSILVFMEAISLALQRLEVDLEASIDDTVQSDEDVQENDAPSLSVENPMTLTGPPNFFEEEELVDD
jgi:hypothetical protein